ncbi:MULTISPECIES: LysR substrate-binding domain-containing protein [Providencia]|uniref:LysR substrate-binding domain-containing protein n=1 Tax=Providencia TaxID=586 RepID=UPI0008381DD6|nr:MULTISPECIES: LysR substrate-binding domain-containing protein [Providencia]MBP6120914.1 LysR family transcriptional regulator [Providencia sp.]MDD9341389.1 LysR substrate-binding domain-containing protein [Providencia heimbachae]NIH23457.1 LysR family transcriptional regulator [Providencia heimbachae]
MRFDITDLRLFLNIIEAGSITGGAALSHIALQSASERIRGMENELGVLLLIRSAKGVSLSNAGHSLAEHAHIVLQQIEHMRSELRQYSQGLRGHINILSNSSAQMEFLPERIGAYLQQQPNMSISVKEMPSSEIVSAIKNRVANLGIVADSTDLTGLDTFPFCDDELVVFTHKNSKWALDTRLSFSDIIEAEFIGLSEGITLQKHIDAHAKHLGQRLNYRVRMPTIDAIMQIVNDGVGIAIIPKHAAMRFTESHTTKIISLTDSWAQRKLVICARQFDQLPDYTNEFIRFITH